MQYGKFYESYKEFVEKIQSKKLVFFGAGSRCLDIIYQYYFYSFEDISFICDNDNTKWGGGKDISYSHLLTRYFVARFRKLCCFDYGK